MAAATIINYIDRQSLGVLWPEIANDLYPDKTDDHAQRKWLTYCYLGLKHSKFDAQRKSIRRRLRVTFRLSFTYLQKATSSHLRAWLQYIL